MSKRVLVTGIAGFVGSHLLEHLLHNTDWDIVGVVTFKHRGDSHRFVIDAWDPSRIEIMYHDLSGPFSERQVDTIGPVDCIINVASESHVDRSIEDPVPFIENNVHLVLNMLELARVLKPRVFLQVSTDEVYGPAPDGVNHAEWSPIKPSNPYSASKAAQEAIAFSYWRTYGVPLVITNTMNMIGERQDAEKFVPLVMGNVRNGSRVYLHGDTVSGRIGSRFYLHARNHADAILHLLDRTPAQYPDADEPDRYNVVGDREVDNLTMAQMIADIIGKPLFYEIINFHASRPGHDMRYALDGSKLAATGWTAPISFEESLERTVTWTLNHPEWLRESRARIAATA